MYFRARFQRRVSVGQYPFPFPPLEVVTGVAVVVCGEVAPGLAGGAFDVLPQPTSAAAAIATRTTLVNLCFAIADLRSIRSYA